MSRYPSITGANIPTRTLCTRDSPRDMHDTDTVTREECLDLHDNMAITPNHFSLYILYLLRLSNTFNLHNRSRTRQCRSSNTSPGRRVRRQEINIHLIHRGEILHVCEINCCYLSAFPFPSLAKEQLALTIVLDNLLHTTSSQLEDFL